MALQRAKSGIQKSKSGGLPRISRGIQRDELSFVRPAKNPIPENMSGTPEERHEKTMKAILTGFAERARQEKIRFDETTATDFSFCIVFEHGSQANAFLRQLGYSDPTAQFVDGMKLAKVMNLPLPETPYKLKALREADRGLARLVTAPLPRSMKK